MAITFEEEKNFGEILAAVFLTVLMLAAVGFFAWKIAMAKPVPDSAAPVNNDLKIDYNVLKDARVEVVELFPEIPAPAPEMTGGRANPFMEGVAPRADKSKKIDGSAPAAAAPAGE